MQSLNKPIILFDIDYTLFDTAIFKKTNFAQYSLYKEVHGVLSDLSKKIILGIFSQGEENLQNTKLKATKIDHFFQKEHIHIELQKEEKIKIIGDKYKNTYLYIADDKLTLLSLVKKEYPRVFTIWIKRGIYAENQKPLPDFTPDAVMENLSGIIPIIDQKHGITLHSH
jgi:phosphoglycolate phosphatase-like HAD superfamily hydrolase